MSDDWFPPQSLCLLEQLLELIGQAFSSTANPDPNQQALQVALLLPFVGRLSCGVAANMTIHTKRGGICVYSRWQDDFWLYLMAIRQRLTKIGTDAQCLDHTIVLGDARTHRLPQGRFHGMLTSPPYPNRHDFGAMFRPERAFLAWLDNRDQPTPTPELPPVIGSNIVKDRKNASPKGRVAGHFLAAVASLKRGRVAEFQDRRYYIPYYANYFADLEQAYANVSSAASSDFTGYIIVRNNSHRTLTIPVAESIVETWQSLGFASEIVSITESFHVGTMNPRARGAKARQLEYVIRVARS